MMTQTHFGKSRCRWWHKLILASRDADDGTNSFWQVAMQMMAHSFWQVAMQMMTQTYFGKSRCRWWHKLISVLSPVFYRYYVLTRIWTCHQISVQSPNITVADLEFYLRANGQTLQNETTHVREFSVTRHKRLKIFSFINTVSYIW